MRSSFVGSSMVHLALLVALFAVPNPTTIVVPGPDVVQVALIQPEALRPQPAVSLPREPEVKAPDITPTEDSGVKLEPPKPPKRKVEREKEPERPRPEPPGPALPFERVGSAGLSGQITVDQASFEFTYYLVLIRNRIAQNWTPPAGLATGGKTVRATVYFKIARSGDLSDVHLESGSGAEFFDRSALRSVLISAPLPPLPLGFTGSDLGVHFGFEYATP